MPARGHVRLLPAERPRELAARIVRTSQKLRSRVRSTSLREAPKRTTTLWACHIAREPFANGSSVPYASEPAVIRVHVELMRDRQNGRIIEHDILMCRYPPIVSMAEDSSWDWRLELEGSSEDDDAA